MTRFILITLFILSFLPAFTEVKIQEGSSKLDSKNYILILSSYEYKNLYSTTIAKKIQYQLEQENPALIFRIVYASLDIQETMLASRLNMQKAFSEARLTPDVILPRILVLIGNESWMLYRIMNLRGLWQKVPVVLCDVHDKILKDYGDFFTRHSFADSLLLPISKSTAPLNVTGVLKNNVSNNIALFIRKTSPALKEIIYISNGYYSDEYAWQEAKPILSYALPNIKLSYFNSKTTSSDSLYHYASQRSADSAAILFNTHPPFLPSLKLPAYSLRDGGEENNDILGGYYTTSDEYAHQTARLVMRIYNGTPVSELPFQYVQNHHFYLNAQAPYLPESGWQKKDLPELIYFNTQTPFFIRHIRVIALVLLLIIIGIISVMTYVRSKKYQKKIGASLWKYKILHERFQVVYDNMPISLLIFNNRGGLLHQNPASEKLQESWQWPCEGELNLFHDLFTDKHIQEKIKKRENISQVLPIQQGRYQKKTASINQEDYNYYRLIVHYIPDETNNTDNILVMLIDSTDIYQEKIKHKKIRNVFNFAMEQASIGVAEYNLYTRTGISTDIWRQHLNLKSKQIFPTASAFKQVNQEDNKSIQQFLTQACQGKEDQFTKEVRVTDEDGNIHYLRQQLKVMEYQPESGQIWVVDLNQNIDKEKEFAAEMYAAIQKAREAERLKNMFIANMSHEIRSPLNAIVGFSNLMINTADPETRGEMIRYIEENNETLLRLVNDIIDLSKIESGSIAFAFSETDVNALFQDITVIYQIKAFSKKLNIKYQLPNEELYILTDKVRIRQVISNFMSNAFKFTEQGTICLGYRMEGDHIYMYVSDTGPGISSEHSSKLFNRFYRAETIYHGFGLGLSIARSVIEGLKGEIGVESEEGKGSTFWFRLPVKVTKCINTPKLPVLNKTIPDNTIRPQLPHLLVVEDDESNFLLMQFMLKGSFRITHACNGKEAIKLFREGHQDLILMDIKMPKKNGYQVTQEIRSLSAGVPIIATTAYTLSKDEALILKSGFNAYLAKPLEKRLLLETINYWLYHAN